MSRARQRQESPGCHEGERQEQHPRVAAPVGRLPGHVPEQERHQPDDPEDNEVEAVVLKVRIELGTEQQRDQPNQRKGSRNHADYDNRPPPHSCSNHSSPKRHQPIPDALHRLSSDTPQLGQLSFTSSAFVAATGPGLAVERVHAPESTIATLGQPADITLNNLSIHEQVARVAEAQNGHIVEPGEGANVGSEHDRCASLLKRVDDRSPTAKQVAKADEQPHLRVRVNLLSSPGGRLFAQHIRDVLYEQANHPLPNHPVTRTRPLPWHRTLVHLSSDPRQPPRPGSLSSQPRMVRLTPHPPLRHQTVTNPDSSRHASTLPTHRTARQLEPTKCVSCRAIEKGRVLEALTE